MIAILGDIHFSSSRPWFIDVSKAFLKWFKEWEVNNSNNTLILVGDLVHVCLNGGLVISFLEEFVNSSNFKEIHICVGNHDKKKQDGIDQLAYEFYKIKPNIHIYEEITAVDIEDNKILFLPYYVGLNKYNLPMNEYYSNLYRDSNWNNVHYNLIVGHCAMEDASFRGNPDCILNLDKLNPDRICLGHIHTRFVNPNVYIGSIFANRRNENDYNRAAWILDNKVWKEEKLPTFCEFDVVSYPEELPKTTALVPIYTILNCSSEALAKKKYGDVHIRKVTKDTYDINFSKQSDKSRKFNSIKDMNIKQLFNSFVSEQTPPLSTNVIDTCLNFIKD